MKRSIPDLYEYLDKVLESVPIINKYRQPTQAELNDLKNRLQSLLNDSLGLADTLSGQQLSKVLAAYETFIEDLFNALQEGTNGNLAVPQCEYLAAQLDKTANNILITSIHQIISSFLLSRSEDTGIPSQNVNLHSNVFSDNSSD